MSTLGDKPDQPAAAYKNTTEVNHKKRPLTQILAAIALVVVGVIVGIFGGRLMNADKASDTEKSADSATSQTAPARAVMAVEAVTPTSVTINNVLDANGVIAATRTAEVSGRLTGVVIERVLVEEGQAVTKGQLLAVLDTKTLSEQRTQAAADLAAAQATRDKAAADLARTEPLLAIDAVSRQEVDAYRTALKQAAANIAAAESRLATARTNEANGNITAPVSGVISAKNAQVGTLASGAPLFSIIEAGALEWQATVAPTDATRISVGQSVLVKLPGGDQTVTGQVTRLSPTANASREVVAHVALPANPSIKAGMYQTGQFIFGSEANPAVPMAALMSSDGYDFVWTLSPAADAGEGLYRIKRQQVSIRGQQDNFIALDLPADALVVAQSANFLNEGDLVTIATVNGQSATGQLGSAPMAPTTSTQQ